MKFLYIVVLKLIYKDVINKLNKILIQIKM